MGWAVRAGLRFLSFFDFALGCADFVEVAVDTGCQLWVLDLELNGSKPLRVTLEGGGEEESSPSSQRGRYFLGGGESGCLLLDFAGGMVG